MKSACHSASRESLIACQVVALREGSRNRYLRLPAAQQSRKSDAGMMGDSSETLEYEAGF